MELFNKIKDAKHHDRGLQPREICWTCRQPKASCYCSRIRRLDSGIDFVILIHPIESRRRIATGRMAHLILQDSWLIEGEDFSKCEKVRRLTADPARRCMILYPGRTAMDLDEPETTKALQNVVASHDKRLTIFVIDGTWATARKMMRLSENLRDLPMVKFQPTQESRFQVRKQPEKHCLSTIEAIHAVLDRLTPQAGNDQGSSAKHDHLLELFLEMVERQKKFVPRFQTV
ncbi:MAG: tRNA-uridine aminocarboxypropyltransferase [Bdellovibrionales bacterium]|nr:tRNA-uridine aminocarboxypropyltransferase [Bdellovibrionales bacterium]